MKQEEMEFVARQINRLAGLNIFENTRKREYIEARSLFCLISYRIAKQTYANIARFFEQNGKSSDHATVLHSLKNYEIYSRYNPNLEIWFNEIIENIKDQTKTQKIELLYHKIKHLSKNNLTILSDFITDINEEQHEQKFADEYVKDYETEELEEIQTLEYINETTEN
jgi:hypothetical protein